MKNRTEENRRNLEMIAPTWTMLGLALAACGGGGGGGGGISVTIPPPINSGPPVPNARIPNIQEAPRGSPPIILTEGQNMIPDVYYRYESANLGGGTVIHHPHPSTAVATIPDITVDASGAGNVGQVAVEVNGLVLTDSERFDGISLNIRVEIDDYITHYDGLTVDEIVDDIVDDSASSIRGDAVSLSSAWTMRYSNGNVRGSAEINVAGAPQNDGSIDVIVSIYEDVNGDLYFSSGSGRTLLGDLGYSFNLPELTPGATELAVNILGIPEGNGYDVPVIFTNVARDGFGNVKIVADDGAIDSAPELLRIDADGITGNAYSTGHVWYRDDVAIAGTGHTYMATEAGRYHAEVAIDLDADGNPDILVETLAVVVSAADIV